MVTEMVTESEEPATSEDKEWAAQHVIDFAARRLAKEGKPIPVNLPFGPGGPQGPQ
jgi:hypothetical protein